MIQFLFPLLFCATLAADFSFFSPFDGCGAPYAVVGGSLNHSRGSYPQFALYDLFDAYELDPTDFGGPPGLSTVYENSSNEFWGVYAGYHNPISFHWDIGVEVGYKQLVRTHTYLQVTPMNSPLVPFRNSDTQAWDILIALKYQAESGFNVFLKAGGAEVYTKIDHGSFISPVGADVSLSGTNAFRSTSYTLKNICPEVEIGAGCRFLNHFEFHISYTKIFAAFENDLISQSALFLPPRKTPSLDFFTLSLEVLIF